MRALRGSPAVIARDERYHLDLVGMEAAKVAVLDQIVRMLVMAGVADVSADVVQQRGIFEPLPFAVCQAMDCARLIEERQCEADDLI